MASNNNPSAVEWELSKENVQPLRHGRKVTSLTAALQPLTGDQLSKIREQRQAFEAELRTYAGDDPLDVWYRYIKWTEENYPKGGKDGHLLTLLEKCATLFKDEEVYKNDQRYLDVWIKFVSYISDPLEMYAFLYDQGIGCELAALYEAWTWELEQVGNTKKADALYQEGINRRACPLDHLERSYREFQARTVRHATANLAEEAMGGPFGGLPEEERVAFGQLKGRGKHKTVGSLRTGAAQAPRTGLNVKTPTLQKPGQSFQIYSEENQMPSSSVPPQTGEWVTVPTRAATHTENDQTPGVWSKAKVSQKTTGVVPISSATSYNKPSFTVHADENIPEKMATPMRLPQVGNNVLSARKPSKEQSTLEHVTQAVEQDGSQEVMYPKHLIYTGVEEFQFEELRAAKWKVKQEDRRRRQEAQRLQEQQEAFRMEMQKQMEAFKQRELALKQREEEFYAKLNAGLERLSGAREDSVTNASALDPSAQPDANVSIRPTASLPNQVRSHPYRASSEATITRQLAFDDFTLHTDLPQTRHTGAAPQEGVGLNGSSHTPNMNGSTHTTLTNSGKSSGRSTSCSHTPDSASSLGPPNRHTPSRCSIAPSPTVNTKEAYEVVMGMFSDGNLDEQLGFAKPQGKVQKMDTTASANSGPFGVPSVPFKIFSENTCTRSTSARPAPFISNNDENDENRAPVGYNQPPKRKALAGISLATADPPAEQSHDQEEHMDGIEISNFVYRDDITLAPLGSQSDFAAAARLASTPFASGEQSRKSGAELNGAENAEGSDIGASPLKEEDPQSYITNMAAPKEKNLSPIMELSEDDVNSVTGANNQTHGGSHLETRPALVPIPDLSEPELEGEENKAPSPVNQSYHVIDTSGYFPTDDKTEVLSMSIAIDPRDPFDQKAIDHFLSLLPEPLSSYPGYFQLKGRMPPVKTNHVFNLGEEMYTAKDKLGEGGFAKVFLVEKFDFEALENVNQEDLCVLKIQNPPCPWEFYICKTVEKRLAALTSPVDVSPSMMSVDAAYFFEDCSCLMNELHENGTLLDLVNDYRSIPYVMSRLEPFAMFTTIELLHMVEKLHKCQIIHGDIKPDNFLVRNIINLKKGSDVETVFGSSTRMLKLIDFGQSIDMTLYPRGTTFTAKVHTSGFQCIEMKTDQPWTYQTDLFGLIGTIHVVIFGEYMKVYQEGGEWKTTSVFPRSWKTSLWKEFFRAMLNIPSCSELPDLADFRQRFEEVFVSSMVPAYNTVCNKIIMKEF